MITRKLLKYTLVAGLSLLGCAVASNLTAAPKSHPDTAGWQNLFAPDLSNADLKPGDF